MDFKFTMQPSLDYFFFLKAHDAARFIAFNIMLFLLSTAIHVYESTTRGAEKKAIPYAHPFSVGFFFFLKWLVLMASLSGNLYIIVSIVLGKMAGAVVAQRILAKRLK